MKSKIILFAKGVIRDAETDSVSVFNIIEGMILPELPMGIPSMDVLSLVEKENDDSDKYVVKISVTLNGKSIQEPQETEVDFQGLKRHRLFLHLGNLAITEPGELGITLDYEDALSCSCTLDLEAAKNP